MNNGLSPRWAIPRLAALLLGIAALATLGGCAVVTVAGAAVGAAVTVTGAVVSTGVKVTGAVVGAAVDVVTPDSDDDKEK
jgi:hypothetical protein